MMNLAFDRFTKSGAQPPGVCHESRQIFRTTVPLCRIFITGKNGIEDKISYIDNQDGKPVVLSGSSNFDEIIMVSQDPYHATSVFTHAGMEVGRSQRTISLSGKE